MTLAEDQQRALVDESIARGDKFKTCPMCSSKLPLTEDFWNLSKLNRMDRCRECEKLQDNTNLVVSKKKGGLLDKIAKGQIMETGSTENLYDEIMHTFGGTREFAQCLKMDYDAAAAGSGARVSIARMVINLADMADKSRRATGDLSDMVDPQDLLRQVASLSSQVQDTALQMPEEEIEDDG